MTRRSIVGPLLLIALGVLFLANTLNPEMPLFQLVAEYWPLLLIGWGALRLIEILVLAGLRKPYPNGLGGGEIAAIVLICVMGSAMYSFQRHFNARVHMGPWGPRTLEIFGDEHEYSMQAEHEAAGVSRIVVDHLRGSIRITGGDAASIRVSGRKTVRAYDDAAADQADRRTPVEIVIDGGRAIIRTNQNRATGNTRISADLEIAVPRGVDVEFKGQYGDVDLTDVGKVLVDSDNAGVRIEKAAGDVRVDARRSDLIRATNVKGNIEMESRGRDIELENVGGEVRIRGSYSGSLQFQNLAKPLVFETRQTELRVAALPGRINMDLGEFSGAKLVGPVRMITRSRDIQIDDVTNSVEIETERGDIEIRSVQTPLARIDARSKSGNIEVAIPEKASFSLEASTERGEAHNGFGAAVTVSSEGPAAKMKGGVGNGPLVRLSTGRGSIAVRKAEGQLQETRL
jgi:DUF4097 and DUF4098 domain-containing protein YvlB